MTLVLSCITRDFIVQVSDRRLTWLNGPNSGSVADDERNKAVVVCNRLVFAYSGLAEIGSLRTDDWLLEVIRRATVKSYNVRAVVSAIATEATDAFRRLVLSRHLKRHAFVAAGWVKLAREAPLVPVIVSISNAVDDRWRWQRVASDQFIVLHALLRPSGRAELRCTGQHLEELKAKRLRRQIDRCIEHNAGPGACVEILAKAIRDAARTRDTIGANLLAVSLPIAATAHEPSLSMPVRSSFASDAVTSVYLAAGDEIGVLYGPHYTCGGFSYSDIELRSGLELSG